MKHQKEDTDSPPLSFTPNKILRTSTWHESPFSHLYPTSKRISTYSSYTVPNPKLFTDEVFFRSKPIYHDFKGISDNNNINGTLPKHSSFEKKNDQLNRNSSHHLHHPFSANVTPLSKKFHSYRHDHFINLGGYDGRKDWIQSSFRKSTNEGQDPSSLFKSSSNSWLISPINSRIKNRNIFSTLNFKSYSPSQNQYSFRESNYHSNIDSKKHFFKESVSPPLQSQSPSSSLQTQLDSNEELAQYYDLVRRHNRDNYPLLPKQQQPQQHYSHMKEKSRFIENEIEKLKEKIQNALKLESQHKSSFYEDILAREKSIDEQLQQRISQSKESAKPIPIPKKKLTADMIKIIHSYLDKDDSFVVFEAFNIPITVKELYTLEPRQWLNDEVINFYMQLLQKRNHSKEGKSFSKIYPFNTFFYSTLVKEGYDRVKRWTRKINLFEMDYIIIPIHLGVHWVLGIIDMKHKGLLYFDSLHGYDGKFFRCMRDYLTSEAKDKLNQILDITEWIDLRPTTIPGQANGFDCGMFTCLYAEKISRLPKGTPLIEVDDKDKDIHSHKKRLGFFFDFDQSLIPEFRKRFQWELSTGSLLDD